MNNPDYICVLDFEATCDNCAKFDNEIIEFPSVLLKYEDNSYKVVSEFQRYCKPIVKPIVTKFCYELTGITQEKVDTGDIFTKVLKDHGKWIMDNVNDKRVIILTCGEWDLGTMMINECKKHKIKPNKTYQRFINIKSIFENFYKAKSHGMKDMLEFLNISLEGRHHSGIDDSRNIAKIFQRMVLDGYEYNENDLILVDNNLYSNKK